MGKIPDSDIEQNGECFITATQLAQRLGITRRTLHSLLRDGKIAGMRVGTQWRFRFSDVESQLHASAEK